jgi:O-antigen chain-terminating methyltransferase
VKAGNLRRDVLFTNVTQNKLDAWTVDRLLALENRDEFIIQAYKLLLDRCPTNAEINNSLNEISNSRGVRINWLRSIRDSDEGLENQAFCRWLILSDGKVEKIEDWPLDELLNIKNDQEFVETAIQVVLNREADPPGVRGGVAAIRSGELNREEYIKALSDSEEGAKRISYKKLMKKFRLMKITSYFCQLPVVGALLCNTKAIFTVDQEINQLKNNYYQLEGELLELKTIIDDLFIYLYERQYDLPGLGFDNRIHECGDGKDEVAENKQLFEDFQEGLSCKFRGDYQEIIERLQVYTPYLEKIGSSENEPIVDVGFGRGEFLELAKQRGLHMVGIDTNQSSVADGISNGFTVENLDAIDYFKRKVTGSIAAVCMIHIVEHIEYKNLLLLLKEIFRCLKNGGLIIVETPNPDNLIVSSAQFYLDPTHLNPIPEALMSYMLSYVGFEVDKIGLSTRNSDFTNRVADKQLNYMLTCTQDYALIGRKK